MEKQIIVDRKIDNISAETHMLVVDTDGEPIVEDGNVLLQAKNDDSYVYKPINANIQKIFGLAIVETEVETNIENNFANVASCSDGEYVLHESEKFIWNHSSTLLLLDEYKNRSQKFRNPKSKKKKLWEEISLVMKQNGYIVDGDSLDRKMRNMKTTYRTIVDNNNKKKTTGTGRIQWPYFNIFQEIFKDDRTVNATPLLSSTRETESVTTSPIITVDNNVIPTSCDESHSPLPSPNSLRNECHSVTPTLAPTFNKKNIKSKQLDKLRKRQLEVEEEKLFELKRIRESMDRSNEIQEKKVKILELLLQNRNS